MASSFTPCFVPYLVTQACGVLSVTGSSRPFDEDADGYIRLEGYATIILRRMPDAIKEGNRVLCNILECAAGSAGAEEGSSDCFDCW